MSAERFNRKAVWSWAFLDWGNSTFSTTVMAGFFPVFFKEYWSQGQDVAYSTFHLGVANSLASLIIALLAPVLGAIADAGGSKKKFLWFFTVMGAVMTSALYSVAAGHWELAVAVYVLATVGFSGNSMFYDALLTDVTDTRRYDVVSAFGYALGYLGGGILFAFDVVMVAHHEWFGIVDRAHAVRISFLLVGIWWAAFSLPVIFFVRELPVSGRTTMFSAVREGITTLIRTFNHIRALRLVFLFLLAYWLYIDGVNTVIKMAVDYGLSLGFNANSLMLALLITQFVGFPAAIAFGRIGNWLGTRNGILLGLAVYMGVTLWAVFLHNVMQFYVMAIAIGLVQGGVQSLSRSLYARLIPVERSAEFFGFYNLLGKFSAILGPVLMGWVGLLTGSPRISILSIGIMFLLGGALLASISVPRNAADLRMSGH